MNFTGRFRVLTLGLLVFAVLISSFVFAGKSLALSWEQVASTGLENKPLNITLVSLVEHNDYLYASVGNMFEGVKIFRSANGTTWTKVSEDGFGDTACFDAVLYVLNDTIYAGTVGLGPSTAKLYQSTSGTTWTQIGSNGLGDAGNEGIVGMTSFNDHLYFGVSNGVTGTEVFRLGDNNALTQVNTDGFDGSSDNSETWALTVFNGEIYAGVGQSAVAGQAEIWKSSNGTDWEKIMDGGFGDNSNQRISAFFTFREQLYAGTLNNATGTEVWRRIADTSWEQVNTDGFGDSGNTWTGDTVAIINGTIYLGTRNDTTGGELFLSTNGETWTQEGSDGFGDVDNYAIYAITFNGRIYLGFSSGDGAEVWRTGEMGTLSLSGELDEGTVGVSYTESFRTENGTSPLAWSVTDGSLPDGISMDDETGALNGTPTRADLFTFTVTVVDSGAPQQLASGEFSIRINDVESEAEVLPETGASYKYLPQFLLF